MSEINANGNSTAEAKDMSLLSRIIGVFVSPAATFNAIAAKPKWLVPGIILIIISLGTTYLLSPIISVEQRQKAVEQMEKRGMEQEQIDEAMAKSEQIMKISLYPTVVISSIIMFVLTAAIWLFFGNVVLGGKAKFEQLLGVVVYRAFIPTVGMLIKAPLMISQKTMNIHFSLATFMPDSAKDTFLYKVLAQFELFNIWAIIALCIGIAVCAKLPTKKVWPLVAIIYVIWFLASAGLAGLLGQ
ncbi:MAG TPA: YIP1 family protein [bacterium]|nr:YIP1 family protein [bacterium]HPN44448.1 YIP1 family protein [bacterium]